MKVRNTFIIFIVSGFWHGADWTFIVWGGLNALYFLPLLLTRRNRKNLEVVAKDSYLPSLKELGQMVLTFGLTVFAWIFFRAQNLEHAIDYIDKIFSFSLFKIPYYEGFGYAVKIFPILFLFFFMEWLGRKDKYAIENFRINEIPVVNWLYYSGLVFLIGMYMATSETDFIYFQF